MSKELEALRNFISECENDWKTQPKRWVNGAINSNVSKYMDSLKSILTPPTADEVCKELSEFVGREVSYTNKQFHYIIKNTQVLMFVTETYNNKTFSLGVYLPPHLITLIGRFYEGVTG